MKRYALVAGVLWFGYGSPLEWRPSRGSPRWKYPRRSGRTSSKPSWDARLISQEVMSLFIADYLAMNYGLDPTPPKQ